MLQLDVNKAQISTQRVDNLEQRNVKQKRGRT